MKVRQLYLLHHLKALRTFWLLPLDMYGQVNTWYQSSIHIQVVDM